MSLSITPKTDFIERSKMSPPGVEGDAGRWGNMVANPLFKVAVEKALLEYVMRQVPDLATPATMAFRIEGAKEVLKVLLNLADPEKPLVRGEEKKLAAI